MQNFGPPQTLFYITARLSASIGDENALIALPPFSYGKERAMFKRRRFKQTESLHDRLATFARLMRERAGLLPPGDEKAAAIAKADQADAAAEMNQWICSPGLKRPE